MNEPNVNDANMNDAPDQAPAQPAPEPHALPAEGGSYIRQPDGTLKRAEEAPAENQKEA